MTTKDGARNERPSCFCLLESGLEEHLRVAFGQPLLYSADPFEICDISRSNSG